MRDNELIAEFMKLDKHPNNQRAYWIEDQDCYLTFDNLQFHQSWNQLMPVVEKIEGMRFSVMVIGKYTRIQCPRPYKEFSTDICETKIQSVYKAVVTGITNRSNDRLRRRGHTCL